MKRKPLFFDAADALILVPLAIASGVLLYLAIQKARGSRAPAQNGRLPAPGIATPVFVQLSPAAVQARYAQFKQQVALDDRLGASSYAGHADVLKQLADDLGMTGDMVGESAVRAKLQSLS